MSRLQLWSWSTYNQLISALLFCWVLSLYHVTHHLHWSLTGLNWCGFQMNSLDWGYHISSSQTVIFQNSSIALPSVIARHLMYLPSIWWTQSHTQKDQTVLQLGFTGADSDASLIQCLYLYPTWQLQTLLVTGILDHNSCHCHKHNWNCNMGHSSQNASFWWL